MSAWWIDSLSGWVLATSLAMARVYSCLIFVPIFGFHELKGPLRYAIVIMISIMVAPGIREAVVDNHSWTTMAGLYAKESMLGIILGVLLSMPFWLFESVGALFDNQRGALMGGQLNPSLGQDFTPLGYLFKQVLIVLMITTGAFLHLLQIIWDSFLLWPPTEWLPVPQPDAFDVYLGLLSSTFKDMVLYALPLVALLLLIEFGMSILSVYAPQLQAFILAMPLKALVGIGFLVLYCPMLFSLADQRNQELLTFKHILLLLFKPQGP